MRSIGIDAHKHFAEIAIQESGKEFRPERISTSPTELRAFVKRLRPDDEVVIEASANTWAIVRLLESRVRRVVVSNPLRTKAIASAKVKTDKVDAGILAQLLAADFIPPVWVPDDLTRRLRQLISRRSALVQQQTRLRNRIHAVLQRNLIECPYSDLFGSAARRWLAGIALPAQEREEIESGLRLLAALGTELDLVERRLCELAVGNEQVRHLMTIPGVGVVTALALVAVIGDVSRFPRPQQLVGYLGLDLRVRQSGDHPAYTGHISRQGQAHARGLLVEAAHSAVRVPGPLHAFYQRVRARRGKQIAAVAVARKLTVLTWHLLTDKSDYRWAPDTLTNSKLRRLELKAGQVSRTSSSPRRSAVDRMAQHESERRVLLQAEEAYRTLVAARQAKGAAATTGEATLNGAKAGRAAEVTSPASALLHGVNRARLQHRSSER